MKKRLVMDLFLLTVGLALANGYSSTFNYPAWMTFTLGFCVYAVLTLVFYALSRLLHSETPFHPFEIAQFIARDLLQRSHL